MRVLAAQSWHTSTQTSLKCPPGPKILTQHLIHLCSSEYGNENTCLQQSCKHVCEKRGAFEKGQGLRVLAAQSWHTSTQTSLKCPPGPKILTQHLIHFCSSEYGNETACLNNHVNTCVKDEPFLNPLRGEISKLLVLLVYHCGNVNSNNVQGVNQLILTTVQCNRGALNSIVNCWDDFRSAFEANKSDTSLCR